MNIRLRHSPERADRPWVEEDEPGVDELIEVPDRGDRGRRAFGWLELDPALDGHLADAPEVPGGVARRAAFLHELGDDRRQLENDPRVVRDVELLEQIRSPDPKFVRNALLKGVKVDRVHGFDVRAQASVHSPDLIHRPRGQERRLERLNCDGVRIQQDRLDTVELAAEITTAVIVERPDYDDVEVVSPGRHRHTLWVVTGHCGRANDGAGRPGTLSTLLKRTAGRRPEADSGLVHPTAREGKGFAGDQRPALRGRPKLRTCRGAVVASGC